MEDPSQFNQATYLLKFLNYKSGFFIEAGANDGVSMSNTYLYEFFLNWKGLLVEPNKNRYIKCKENRPNSIVENVALVSSEYQKEFIRGSFEGDTNSMTARVIDFRQEVFNKNYFKEILLHLRQRKIVKVKASTLDNLLAKHNVKEIDLLYLDTEEYELPILKGINLDKTRPKFIVVEIFPSEKSFNSIKEHLTENNYEFIERIPNTDDYIFKDRNYKEQS